jgi:hypothetical protein
MFPDGLTTMFDASPAVLEPGISALGDPVVVSNRESVGVGGVTVVRGVSMMRAVGVRGRRELSRLGIELV